MRMIVALLPVFFSAVVAGQAQDLKRLDLERPSELGLTISADSSSRTEGAASIRVQTLWPTSVCLGQVSGVNVEDATLLFKAAVKTELEGSAFLEMWVRVDGKEYFSRGMNDAVAGNSDWRTIQTPFVFQKGQSPERVTLNLIINGHGTVWIDEVTLSKATP